MSITCGGVTFLFYDLHVFDIKQTSQRELELPVYIWSYHHLLNFFLKSNKFMRKFDLSH